MKSVPTLRNDRGEPVPFNASCEVCKRIIPLVEVQSDEIQALATKASLYGIFALCELFLLVGLAVYALIG